MPNCRFHLQREILTYKKVAISIGFALATAFFINVCVLKPYLLLSSRVENNPASDDLQAILNFLARSFIGIFMLLSIILLRSVITEIDGDSDIISGSDNIYHWLDSGVIFFNNPTIVYHQNHSNGILGTIAFADDPLLDTVTLFCRDDLIAEAIARLRSIDGLSIRISKCPLKICLNHELIKEPRKLFTLIHGVLGPSFFSNDFNTLLDDVPELEFPSFHRSLR